METEIREKFAKIFGDGGDIRMYFAPGRVNLIGEHTDYNGGHVFPCALTIGTYAVVRKRNDKKVRYYSMNFEKLGVIEAELSKLVNTPEADWTNYPTGMIWTFKEKGYEITNGFDMLLYGNIPNGSGLSSSASVEVVTGVAINDLYEFGLSNYDIAFMGQYSENHFNGVNCGIMDQFAVAMGKKDNAIFLDTAEIKYEYAPIKLADAKIVIACSNKKRGLGDSKYNERRKQCEEALSDLKKEIDIKTLGDLDTETFEKVKYIIKDDICRARAKHAVYENQRTIDAVKALKENDIEKFGRLMNKSHVSLRDDYEVTGKELDTLAEAAWKQQGVIGSRMTGAGFGGCTVSIVNNANINEFIKNVGDEYSEKIGYKADFYVVEIGCGAGKIE